MKYIAHVFIAAIFVLVSCTPVQMPTPTTPSATPTSAAAIVTVVPSPTNTPPPTATLSIPVAPQTPVPASSSKISPENISDLQEVARYYGQVKYFAKLTKDRASLFILDPDGITMYNYETMEALVYVPVSNTVSDLQMSNDGSWLIIDNKWLLDLRNEGQPVLQLLEEKIDLLNLYEREFSLSPDGSMIAAEQIHCYDSCDYKLQVVSTEDFGVLHVSTGLTRQAHPVFSPDGAYLALADMFSNPGLTGYAGAVVTLRNTTDFLKGANFQIESPFYVTDIAFSEDSRLLAVAQTLSIDVFDIATGNIEVTIPAQCEAWDRKVMFASSTPLQIAASSTCDYGMWTISEGSAVPSELAAPIDISRIAFDSNGNPENIPYPYPSTGPKSYRQQYDFQFLSGDVIAFKRDDNDTHANHSCQLSLSSGSLDCRSYDLMYAHGGITGNDLLLGTDGQYYSYVVSTRGAEIYSVTDPSQPHYSISGEKSSLDALDAVNKLLFHQAPLANDHGRIAIEDMQAGDVITKWEGETYLTSIAFSEDKKTAALCRSIGPIDFKGQLVIFDRVQRKSIFSLDVTCTWSPIALTNDGSKLALEYYYLKNPTDELFSIRTMIMDTSGSFERKFIDIESSSRAVAFSPDGSLLAIACGEMEICFLDPADGRELYRLQAHSELTNLAFSGDGRLLAASSQWGLISVWGIPPFAPKEQDAEAENVSQLPVCLPGDEIIDVNTTYKFQVEPVDGATGYLWQFVQEGTVIWQLNPGEPEAASASTYEIPADSTAHDSFAPGHLEVWVRALVDNDSWTPFVFMSACLQGEKRILPSPTPTAEPTAEHDTLYSEDFEDGEAPGWSFDGSTWTIEQEKDGNHYWQGTGTVDYPSAGYDPSKTWTDFAFEARFRLTARGDKTFNMTFRSSPEGAYIVAMSGEGYMHIAVDNGSNYKVIKERSYPIKPGQWYLARVEAQGNQIRLYIDDALVLSAEDNTTQSGSIGIFIYGGDPVHVDQIQVRPLSP